MKEVKCPHYEESVEKAEGVYIYNMGDNCGIYLCDCCNMNLAGEIMKQVALELFTPKIEYK